MADKLLVVTALIFLIGRGVPKWMAWALIAREFAVVGLRLVAPKAPISPSFMGKLKTALEMVGVVAVLLKFWAGKYILLFAVAFSIASGFEYYWAARKWLRWRKQLDIQHR
jgi:CDP-diacylglycerol--glycerol-3-phosphate 3-phosphatidyltransferase